MDEEELDKLFECFKKCEPNRCAKKPSSDKLLYYNKPNNENNCSSCRKVDEYKTSLSNAPEPTKPVSEPAQSACDPAKCLPELEKPELPKPEPAQSGNEPTKVSPEVPVAFKCCRKNSTPITETMQKPTAKIDSLEQINNALCSACQNIDMARNDFRHNMMSLQNQIDSTYRNIESVRDLNKDLKNGVCCLQSSLNNLKAGKNSQETVKTGNNVELLCACKPVQKQPETPSRKYSVPTQIKCGSCHEDQPLISLKQPSSVRCCKSSENQIAQLVNKMSRVTIGETKIYSNESIGQCYPCNEDQISMSSKNLSFVRCGETQPVNQIGSYSNRSDDKCYPCNKDRTSISSKKPSLASCCETQPVRQIAETAEEGTSIIDNISKCAEQCRQYLDALASAARATTTTKTAQNGECAWKQNIEPIQEVCETNSVATQIRDHVTESSHKCLQCSNKANSAAQVGDFKTTNLKYDAQVQSEWKTNDQATQCTNLDNVSTVEVAVGNDQKECTHKGVQCSNKKNNATQSDKPIRDQNNVEVQSTWDKKNQVTQYDQVSNVETEIFGNLIKCSNKCTQSEISAQRTVQTEVCKLCNIQGSAKFSSDWKDEATQSIGKNATNTAHKCAECSSVKQNATQVDDLNKCARQTKDQATLAVNEAVPKTERAYKCQQCSTEVESSAQTKTVEDNDKVHCAWKKANQATQATQEVQQNLYNEAAEANKCIHCMSKLGYSAEMNNFKTFSLQSSVKSQTESAEILQTSNVQCTTCAKKTETGKPAEVIPERTNTCQHCSNKINATAQTDNKMSSADDCTQSSWKVENKTTQSIAQSHNRENVGKDLTACAKCQQFSNGINNGTQSEKNDDDSRKNAAVQCVQKSYNAGAQSINRDAVEASIGSNVTDCVDKCQQHSTKTHNAAQTEKFESTSVNAQCTLEAEDKILQAAVTLCRHCLNKLKNPDDVKGFSFQNSIKSQTEASNSISDILKNESMRSSLQNTIKVQTASDDNISKNLSEGKNKCQFCTNAAQTDSVKSFNLQTSIKSQTETCAALSKQKTRNMDSIDKGVQSSDRRDRGSQTDKTPIKRNSVKIQTDTARKKSNSKRSSFTSETDLKRSSSRIRTQKQQAGHSSSGILKNNNKSSKKKYSSGCQTYNVKTVPNSSVSLSYAGNLYKDRSCSRSNNNYCDSGSSYRCYNKCSDAGGYTSCYLWP